MSQNHDLPDAKDTLFRLNPIGQVNANLEHLKSEKFQSLYASAFKQAGDAVLQRFEETFDWYREPELFMPAMFCYRHYIELTLKWHLACGQGWKIVTVSGDDLKGHGLHRLWNLTLPVIHTVWRECGRETLAAAERIVFQIHQIDESGQNMRYASDTFGNHTLARVPDIVSLDHLRDTVAKLGNFFERLNEEWDSWLLERTLEELQTNIKSPTA